MSAADISQILGAPIGRATEQDSADKSTCVYPPADASSSQQAHIEIEWQHGEGASPERQLLETFGNSVPGRQAAHGIPLGDEASYSREGILSVRTGPALITITLLMRPDSEAKAIAIGTRILDQLKTKNSPSTTELPPGTKPMSDISGLWPGLPCPDPGAAGTAAMARAASARVPLKIGLTLANTWKANSEDYEHECLTQITEIDNASFLTTGSCPIGPKHELKNTTRRFCIKDLVDSTLYLTARDPRYPETFVGALAFNLSQATFAAFKAQGEYRSRYLGPYDPDPQYIDTDVDANMKSEGSGSFKLLINDQEVDVPTLESVAWRQAEHQIMRMKVLDDAAFPIVLDFYIPTLNKFFITYNKVTFPAVNELEQRLTVDKHTDVYGIYFDFGSATLRNESEPVLREIAAAMRAHPDWKLIINGHTDNVGEDAKNLELSRQRAITVRKALTEQLQVDSTRLSTNGYGASQPKEPNDTDRGRARNRRVELVRQ